MLNNVSRSAAAVPHQMGRCEDCYPEKSHFVTHLSAWHKMLVGVAAAHDLFCNHHWSNKHVEDGWKSHWVNAPETRKTNYYQKYLLKFRQHLHPCFLKQEYCVVQFDCLVSLPFFID